MQIERRMREGEGDLLKKTDSVFNKAIIDLVQGFNLLASDSKKCNTT